MIRSDSVLTTRVRSVIARVVGFSREENVLGALALITVWAAAWVMPMASCSVPSDASPGVSQGAGIDPAEHLEHSTAQTEAWFDQLRQEDLDDASRQHAALKLLGINDPKVHERLSHELRRGGDPKTQRLILEALAKPSSPLSASVPAGGVASALFEMFPWVQEPLIEPLAKALGQLRDRRLIKMLVDLAADESLSTQPRRAAILALGYHRSRGVANTLIQLIDDQQPLPVQKAAYASLAQFTGITNFKEDPDRWRQWWEHTSELSGEYWLTQMIDQFAHRVDQLDQHNQELHKRLVDVHRQLYRATPQRNDPHTPDQRSARLIAMLQNDLPAIRQLAIELCEQRLIDALPIDADLRSALRIGINDPSPIIRQRTVQLMQDLADDLAADMVAQRLLTVGEQDPNVLRACWAMMARLPRVEVVDQSLQLLEDPELGRLAAGFLAAADDAEPLKPAPRQQAVERVRAQLDRGRLPDAQSVKLLGRIGSEEDWQRIAYWMDSQDNQVKQAAAQVWADSVRPLVILAQRAGDPVIQPILIEAARRRGNQAHTLMALVHHKPEQEQSVQAWQRALTDMAKRVPIEVVQQVNQLLAQQGQSADLREQVLSAAIESAIDTDNPSHPDPPADPATPEAGDEPTPQGEPSSVVVWPGEVIDLLLTRAELRLAKGDPVQSLADYQQVHARWDQLDHQRQQRCLMGVIRVRLASGEVEDAFAAAEALVASSPNDASHENTLSQQIAEPFLEAARRSVTSDQPDLAQDLLSRLREVLGPDIPASLGERIAQLQPRADAGGETPDTAASGSNAPSAPDTPGGADPPSMGDAQPQPSPPAAGGPSPMGDDDGGVTPPEAGEAVPEAPITPPSPAADAPSAPQSGDGSE